MCFVIAGQGAQGEPGQQQTQPRLEPGAPARDMTSRADCQGMPATNRRNYFLALEKEPVPENKKLAFFVLLLECVAVPFAGVVVILSVVGRVGWGGGMVCGTAGLRGWRCL